MSELIKLSLADIDVIKDNTEEDGSIDFALAKLKFIGTSTNEEENSQGYLLSEKVLKEYANTALGKLITGKINPYSKDLMSHEDTPLIFGYIPPNSQITFEQNGTRWFAICEAVISKIYCKEVIDAFRYDNDRCVSIEASIETSPNNPKEIESFSIHSVTILSKIIKGAVKGANMEIIKFSSEKAEEYYNKYADEPLKKFAEDRKKKMKIDDNFVSNKIDKKDYVESDWDGEKAKHDAIKEKNFNTIAQSIFLKLDSDYKERKIGSLHYPVMGLYNGTWKYNAEGLSSALAYGKQHDQTVSDKVIEIQKKLGLYKEDNKEGKMEKDVKFSVEIGNLWSLVYSKLESKYPDVEYGSIYRVYGIYEDGTQKFAVIYRKDESTKYRLNFNISEEKIEFDGDITEVKETFEEVGNIKKFSEDGDVKYTKFEDEQDIIMGAEDKKPIDTDPEKQLGTETPDPQNAKNTREENEAKWSNEELELLLANSPVKDTILGLFSDNSIEGLVSKLVVFAEEKEKLEKEKEEVNKEKADVKFSQIMAMAKLKLDDGKYKEIYKKGETLKFAELESFERDVKACICDAIVFSDTIESNPTVSFGTHLKKQPEQKTNSIWD